MKQTFDVWLGKVDAWLNKKVGLSTKDLSDCCYYDYYESGMRPASAGKKALEADGYYE